MIILCFTQLSDKIFNLISHSEQQKQKFVHFLPITSDQQILGKFLNNTFYIYMSKLVWPSLLGNWPLISK